MQARGRWIIHEVGCQKLCLVSSSFYTACFKRISPSEGFEKYAAWMSSVALAKEVVSGEIRNEHLAPSALFDTSPEYLSAVDGILQRLLETEAMNGFPGLAVMSDVVLKPKTVRAFQEALESVSRWPEWQSRLFKSIVISIVPITDPGIKIQRGNAFSDHNFVGCLFAGVDWRSPYPELDLSISFAHELGHQALMLYQQSGNLFKDDGEWVYSGVRKTLRPVVSSLHAAVALAYMIECATSLLSEETDVGRISYLKSLIDEYQEGLEQGLTALGVSEKSDMCEFIYQDLKILVS